MANEVIKTLRRDGYTKAEILDWIDERKAELAESINPIEYLEDVLEQDLGIELDFAFDLVEVMEIDTLQARAAMSC